MLHTSIGYHTISIFQRFDNDEIDLIMKDFKSYSETTGNIMIYPSDKNKTCYKIKYKYKRKGIYWLIRFCHGYKIDFCEYIVEAKINPKLLAGEVDYITAADESILPIVEMRFNEEAQRISKHLGTLYDYRLNRIDYCVNFDLLEMGITATPSQIMKLIERGNIPPHYSEYKLYDTIGHRMKSLDDQFYLKSRSVVINIYGKYAHLQNNYPDNPSLETSKNIVRFEIQCKYLKLYALSAESNHSRVNNRVIMRHLLSNAIARSVIINYFDRVIMRGNYYTLKEATERVLSRRFRESKEKRMIDTLNLINQQRGICNAKDYLHNIGGDLHGFNQALHELVAENINPVTIPKRFGIKRIPGLLDAFFQLEWRGESFVESFQTLFKMSKKKQ